MLNCIFIQHSKIFTYLLLCYFIYSCSLSQLDGCMCPICLCTCNTTFRRDQLQSIHTAKHYEHFEKSQHTSSHQSSQMTGAATASVIGQLTNVITDIAKDSIIQVLQQDSPTKSPKNLHKKLLFSPIMLI